MDERRRQKIKKCAFWALSLLWLPAGILCVEALRTGSLERLGTPLPVAELLLAAPLGLPLAPACRRLARVGYPGAACMAWLALGACAAAGLLGALPAGVQALLASLPVWAVVWRLERRPRLEFAPSLEWLERGGSPARLMLRALSGPEAPRRSRYRRTS